MQDTEGVGEDREKKQGTIWSAHWNVKIPPPPLFKKMFWSLYSFSQKKTPAIYMYTSKREQVKSATMNGGFKKIYTCKHEQVTSSSIYTFFLFSISLCSENSVKIICFTNDFMLHTAETIGTFV